MIGQGKWLFHIDTMFFNGDTQLIVGGTPDQYEIDIILPGMELPDLAFANIAQDGNTITGTASTSLLKGKDIPFSLTFEGETASGFLKIPFLGKVHLDDGKKIG
ncbi:MAG: hypothetical protein LBJ11_01015 [Oscillospiraceae bacterium]|nr:hypothetical protein [Oscillospiraceae bacterium]